MSAKIRSFVWHVQREEGIEPLTFKGSLEGDVFTLQVAGVTVELTALERGTDEFGEYAYIAPFSRKIGSVTLSIEEVLDARDEARLVFTLGDEAGRVDSFSLNAAGNEDGSSSAPVRPEPQDPNL